jgi:nitrogen regulatory protein P-II 1
MSDKVINALEKIGTPRFTAIDIRARGDEVDAEHLEVSSQYAGTYTTMVKLEIVCADYEVGRIMNVIFENARTGYKGDGIIVVSPVEEVLKIRTGSKDVELEYNK